MKHGKWRYSEEKKDKREMEYGTERRNPKSQYTMHYLYQNDQDIYSAPRS